MLRGQVLPSLEDVEIYEALTQSLFLMVADPLSCETR